MAELRDELSAIQRESVSTAQIQRAVALFDPVWDLLLVPERFRIFHLLLESVGYDGSTGELELSFYPIGITSLAAEAAMIGQLVLERFSAKGEHHPRLGLCQPE